MLVIVEIVKVKVDQAVSLREATQLRGAHFAFCRSPLA